MAFVLDVIFSAIRSGSILKVAEQISAKTGTAFKVAITSAVAIKVKGVVITSSPSLIPMARSAKSSASVPLATPTAWGNW